MNIRSIIIDSGDNPTDYFLQGAKTFFGVFPELKVGCDSTLWLCPDAEAFINEGFYRVVAKTIQLYAQNKVIQRVLNSGNINSFTMMSREHLYGLRNHNKKEATDRLIWLSKNLPENRTVDCYMCKEGNSIFKVNA